MELELQIYEKTCENTLYTMLFGEEDKTYIQNKIPTLERQPLEPLEEEQDNRKNFLMGI